MVTYYLQNDLNGEIFYVGWTSNVKSRIYYHNKLSKDITRGKTMVYRYIRKYCLDNFSLHILEEYNNLEDIKENEIFYISYFKYLGFKLRNMTVGGDGALGCVRSEETRKKISEAKKGIPNSESHKLNCSKSLKGLRHTEDTKNKISEAHKGKPKSDAHKENMKGRVLGEETRKKISEAHKGKKLSEEHKQLLSKIKLEAHQNKNK